MLSVRLQIAIISTRWSTKLARFVPHSTQSSEVECIDSILWKSTRFVPRSSKVEKIESICATFDLIIHGGEYRLDSHSGENRLDHSHYLQSEFWNGREPFLNWAWSSLIFFTQGPMMWRNRVNFLHRGWSSWMWHESTQWSSRTWLELSRFCWPLSQ